MQIEGDQKIHGGNAAERLQAQVDGTCFGGQSPALLLNVEQLGDGNEQRDNVAEGDLQKEVQSAWRVFNFKLNTIGLCQL